jgi:hypothetical protein
MQFEVTTCLPFRVWDAHPDPQDKGLGTLNSIDYDGITATCVQWQDHFYPARKGVKNIAIAIRNGLRGKQLIPAILRDCRAWMFMRPDMYVPTILNVWSPQYLRGVSAGLHPPISRAALDSHPTNLINPLLSHHSMTYPMNYSFKFTTKFPSCLAYPCGRHANHFELSSPIQTLSTEC